MGEETGGISDARKEQIKLRATFINNIGIGTILIGVLTPITRVILDSSATNANIFWVGGWMAICVAIGFGLHLFATRFLRRLDR